MTKINVNAALAAALSLTQTIEALDVRKVEIGGALEAARAELSKLRARPVERADALAFVLRTIDLRAARFPQRPSWRETAKAYAKPTGPRPNLSTTVNAVPEVEHGGPLNVADVMALNDIAGFWRMFDTEHGFFGPVDSMEPSALYYFFGDIIKQKVTARFDELFPELVAQGQRGSLGLAEADSLIAAAEARVSELDADLAEVQAQLDELKAAARTVRQ